jgi:hypothetical protein
MVSSRPRLPGGFVNTASRARTAAIAASSGPGMAATSARMSSKGKVVGFLFMIVLLWLRPPWFFMGFLAGCFVSFLAVSRPFGNAAR